MLPLELNVTVGKCQGLVYQLTSAAVFVPPNLLPMLVLVRLIWFSAGR